MHLRAHSLFPVTHSRPGLGGLILTYSVDVLFIMIESHSSVPLLTLFQSYPPAPTSHHKVGNRTMKGNNIGGSHEVLAGRIIVKHRE